MSLIDERTAIKRILRHTGRFLDVYPRFWQAPKLDIAASCQFWQTFGLCGPVPIEKRFLIN